MTPERDHTPIPEFTQPTKGEPSENTMDENEILNDQDVTRKLNPHRDDENLGAKSLSYESLEDEPGDFMRGEVDVKEQMDRAADAMESSIFGYQNQSTEDSPRTEIGASFQHTPGGLEEVEQKTDEWLATHSKPRNRHSRDRENLDRSNEHTGEPGGETGAYTDIGAGRSGVTRKVNPDDKNHLR